MSTRTSRTAAVAAYLTARANTWISALELMPIGGALSWRTRVSDCRKAPHYLDIRNRTRATTRSDGRRVLISEYMLVEKTAVREVKDLRKVQEASEERPLLF